MNPNRPKPSSRVLAAARLTALSLALTCAPSARAADATGARAPAAPATHVVRFEEVLTDGGSSVGVFLGDDGRPVRLRLSAPGQPDSDVAATLKGQSKDALVELTIAGTAGKEYVAAAKPYDAAEGEKEPGTWVFDGTATQKIGAATMPTVQFHKLGRSLVTVIPTRRSVTGPAGPDAAVSEKVAALKPGDVVCVEVTRQAVGTPSLLGVEPYVAPVEGDLVGGDMVDHGLKKIPALKLAVAGETKTYPLAWVDMTGRPLAQAQVWPAGRFLPGERVKLLLRKIGDDEAVKGARFAGTVLREGNGAARLDVNDGYFTFRDVGNTVVVYAYLEPRGPEIEAEHFAAGLPRLMNRAMRGGNAAGVSQEQIVALQPLQNAVAEQVLTPGALGPMQQLYAAWAGSTGDAHDDAEQQLLCAANNIIRHDWAVRFEVVRRAHAILAPGQYREVVDLGGGPGPADETPPPQPTDLPKTPTKHAGGG